MDSHFGRSMLDLHGVALFQPIPSIPNKHMGLAGSIWRFRKNQLISNCYSQV